LAQFLSGDSIKPNLTAKQSKVAMYSQFPINDPGTPSLMNLNLQPMPPAPQGGSKPATLKQPPPPASSAAARKLAATQPPAKHPLPPRGPGSYSKTANPNSSPGLAAFGAHGHQSASLSKKGLSSKETEETLKNKGNSAFGQENYTKAADFYTQALQINESNHILYSNRSAAYLALNQPTLAKLDAIKCVGIEPKYVKGHFRLAQAHLALEDYDRHAILHHYSSISYRRNALTHNSTEHYAILRPGFGLTQARPHF
jgi:tetratricopeptide (TPR) repeat protein